MVPPSFTVRAAVRTHGLAVLLVLAGAGPAWATGFFVNQQSVTGLGRVGAGNAAFAEDLGTIFFNPAGLTELWRDGDAPTRVEAGLHLIVGRSKFRNTGSTAATPGTLGAAVPFAGADARNPADPAWVPNFYLGRELVRRRAAVGLGFNAPFGLTTEFPSDWFGRYDTVAASLRTINISAVGAYRFDSGVSVGGGLDVQYARIQLVTAIPDPFTPGGPTPATDGRANTRGRDWTPGFNIGVRIPVTTQTRVGLHYRSRMTHAIHGSTTVSGLAGPLASFNRAVGARADVHLPDILALGARHTWSEDLQLLATVEWYNWSRFREVRTRFDDGSPDAVRQENYRDAYAFAVGAEYRASAPLTLRGGIRFDQTPTVNGFRDTAVPDADRLWLGLGATYQIGRNGTLDLAFNHVFFRRANIAVTRTFFEGTPLASSVSINARVRSVVNTLAIAYRHAF